MASNYSYNNSGVVIPDTADVQEEVQSEFTEALGTDLSLEEETPQGRLIDTETQARVATLTFNADMANVLINFTTSSGTALDAWGENFNISRVGAYASTVPVLVTGIANTVIPADAQASANGVIWLNESEIIIGSNGTATGTFYCSETGAIELGIGELNTVIGSSTLGVSGWETITNTAVATPGADRESDTSYKKRILAGLFSGSALFGNYKSACIVLDNVSDVFTYDNPYGEARQLDNWTIPAHSVFVCVEGGDAEEVAYALYEVKSAGCGWSGNTSVVVTDKTYNTSNPVEFYIPASVNIAVELDLTAESSSDSDLENTVKDVIVSYFAGEYADNNYDGLGIRALISPSVISAVVTSQVSGISITGCRVGLVTPEPHAIASIIKASITSGVTWASVDTSTFGSAVSANGTYNFTYTESGWQLSGAGVDLATYGVTIEGTPVEGDLVSILYADGNLAQDPIRLFCTETAAISTDDITVNING